MHYSQRAHYELYTHSMSPQWEYTIQSIPLHTIDIPLPTRHFHGSGGDSGGVRIRCIILMDYKDGLANCLYCNVMRVVAMGEKNFEQGRIHNQHVPPQLHPLLRVFCVKSFEITMKNLCSVEPSTGVADFVFQSTMKQNNNKTTKRETTKQNIEWNKQQH